MGRVGVGQGCDGRLSATKPEEVRSSVRYDEDRPVVFGLLALVGVAVAVGLVASVAFVVGAHVVGLSGGHAAVVAGDDGATMVVPKPQKTQPASGPSITLGSSSPSEDTQSPPPKIKKPKKSISLQAGETSVAPMGCHPIRFFGRRSVRSACRRLFSLPDTIQNHALLGSG